MRLLPVKITKQRMEHIRSKSGRGHIRAHEIIEILRDPKLQIRKNKRKGAGDYLVRGKTFDGKELHVCVKILNEGGFKSELITAWEAS